MYIENPKTKGSGIMCAIPQEGICPIGCDDCFFQSGRSYLEPLESNLPNMPNSNNMKVFRINDGNDSNNNQKLVMESTFKYKHRFYNTSIIKNLDKFNAPVVLTVNPKDKTDIDFNIVEKIPNIMFVRIGTNTWNVIPVVDYAVKYYSGIEVPIVLTFMAYHDESYIPVAHKDDYIFRERTLNSYWAITTKAWREIMNRYEDNIWVYSCGKIEGEKGKTSCSRCGNCLREYYVTMCRINNN